MRYMSVFSFAFGQWSALGRGIISTRNLRRLGFWNNSSVLIANLCSLQLREIVNGFCQKELAPYADQIDKENNFPQLRVSVHNITIYKPPSSLTQLTEK